MLKPTKQISPDHISYSDNVDPDSVELPEDNDPIGPDGTAVFEKPIIDQQIYTELNLPQGRQLRKAKVVGQTTDKNGKVTGSYDTNPFLNTLTCDIEFPDGEIREYSANVIAENIYAQVDDEGHSVQILDAIVNCRKDSSAFEKADMRVHTKSGQCRLRQITSRWSLLILQKNGEKEWMPLNKMKLALPLETAEFAVARGTSDKPAFKWWVPYILRH